MPKLQKHLVSKRDVSVMRIQKEKIREEDLPFGANKGLDEWV
jgi:hypothetical protein